MKRILYFLIVSVGLLLINAENIYASHVAISNLSIEFSDPNTVTNRVTATFRWQTYNAPSSTVVDLTIPQGTIIQPTPSNCGATTSTEHCYKFTDLVIGETYSFTAKSLASGETQEATYSNSFTASGSTTTITPGATYNFSITPNQTSGIVAKGHTISYVFTITNTGNADDSVTLSLPFNIPSAWNATLSPQTFSNVQVNSQRTATLTFTPSATTLSPLSTSIHIASSKGYSGDSSAVATSIDAPPSAPGSLNASALSTSSIRLTWVASTDNSGAGVAGYEIYNDSTGNFIATTSTTTYDHTGLNASTQYRYKVRAFDNNSDPKNYSEFSTVASATTFAVASNPNTPTPPPPTTTTPPPSSPTPPPPTTTTPPPSSPTPPPPATLPNPHLANLPVLLQGKVLYPDGSPAIDALISIWQDTTLGTAASTSATAWARTGSNGEFSFEVIRSTWRLSATKTNGSIGYRSNDITIAVLDSTYGVNISLIAIPVFVPPPTIIQKPVSERISTTLLNGATVDIPASSISATGNVTLNVSPTVEAHEYSTSQVVGLAYDIVIRNEAGVEVKTFVQPIDLTFPYDDATLAALAVGADNLVPSFYDEVMKKWVPIPTFTVDKVNKRVIAKVTHLTRFALIAAADVTAPTSPTLVTATQTSAGVVIRWVNPVSDFRHAKIYRSTENGKLGTVLFGEVAGTTQTDTSAAPGGTYYYVVRSVDPAGNESTNTAQVAVGASASGSSSGAVSTSGLRRYLRVGMSGTDVKLIQQIMVREGVYVEGFTTGYFGRLTQKAAIKFQEKYRAEILTPAGLTTGNGYVGPKTLQKFIELKAKYSL